MQIDSSNGVVTLRVVYYGPPASGKTTNLESISPLIPGNESDRLIARQVGENRIVSFEIPAGSLGTLMGRRVAVRLETMQGEVSCTEGGWSEALANADGIVFVADSSPHARTANVKALAAVRGRFEGRGRSAAIPFVMQWNKRDRADARPIAELESELNHGCFRSIQAVASRGTGATQTLIAILELIVAAEHRKAGVTAPADADATLTASIERLSRLARAASIERFGEPIERQPSVWPAVSESSKSYVERAETSAARMLVALDRATAVLDGHDVSGLPNGLMAGLLAGCNRTRGSLLLFRAGTQRLDECEVVPAGSDPLNARRTASGGTKAALVCAGREPQFIEDLESEAAETPRAAWIVPLVFGSRSLGGLIVYVTDREDTPSPSERAYWSHAARLASVYLAWQSAMDPGADARRLESPRRATPADTSAS
jgi:mutual gliding-motility protein MglA